MEWIMNTIKVQCTWLAVPLLIFVKFLDTLSIYYSQLFFSTDHSWGYLVLLYVFVQLARVAVVGVLYPFLQYFGYGLDWREAIILVWSGLRGAVALSLSLSVKASSSFIYINASPPHTPLPN